MPIFDTKGLTARVLDSIEIIRQEDDRVATKAVNGVYKPICTRLYVSHPRCI